MEASDEPLAQSREYAPQCWLLTLMHGALNDLGVEYAGRSALYDLVVVFAMRNGRTRDAVDADAVSEAEFRPAEFDIIEGDGALLFVDALRIMLCTKEELCSVRRLLLDEAAQCARKRCAGDERRSILAAEHMDVPIAALLPALSLANEERSLETEFSLHRDAFQDSCRIRVRTHASVPPSSDRPARLRAKRKNACQYA